MMALVEVVVVVVVVTSLGSTAACFKANDSCTRASTPPGGSPKNRPICQC